MTSDRETPVSRNKNSRGFMPLALLNRFSSWIYRLIRVSILGRFMTAYTYENSFLYNRDEKKGKNSSSFRRQIASVLEASPFLRAIYKIIDFFLSLPVNIYGLFFIFYGIVTTVMYYIMVYMGNQLGVEIGHMITGSCVAAVSVPLLFISDTPRTAFKDSRFGRKLLHDRLGIPLDRSAGHVIQKFEVLSIAIGSCFGVLTIFIDPLIVPCAIALILIFLTICVIPETGIIITVSVAPFLWIWDSSDIILPLFVALVWISYSIKLILGKRTFRIDLLGCFVILFGANLLLNGLFSSGGAETIYESLRYCVLLSCYFPIVNLMRTGEWPKRCAGAFSVPAVIITLFAVLIYFTGDIAEAWCVRVGAESFYSFIHASNIAFDHSQVVSVFLMLSLPIMWVRLKNAGSAVMAVFRLIFILAATFCLFLYTDVWAWISVTVGFILFLLLYSHKTLSVLITMSVPFVCGSLYITRHAVNLDVGRLPFFRAASESVARLSSLSAQLVSDSVKNMILTNPFGIGIGNAAFQTVYPAFAYEGLEAVKDTGSFYLQITAGTGIPGMLLFIVTTLLFTQKCFEYLGRAEDNRSKSVVLALFTGIATLLIYGVYTCIWSDLSQFFLFWAAIGLAGGFIDAGYDENLRNKAEHDSTAGAIDATIMGD